MTCGTVGLIFFLAFASLGAEITVHSRLVSGRLLFEEVPDALEYRVEWSSSPGGTWRTFRNTDMHTLEELLPTGGGTVDTLVPLYYKIVATLHDSAPPHDMLLIPPGAFAMGDPFREGGTAERPVHSVALSAFYLAQFEVTWGVWSAVYDWAVAHGYDFDNTGEGKSDDHPVQSINWYDAVKWCNALSEKDGLPPAYYTSATWSTNTVYRSGRVEMLNDWVHWTAGYRLPTEAEWEKAARGGHDGHRFPWMGDMTIQHARANYFSTNLFLYDVSPTRGFHPVFGVDGAAFTSPVGSFAPNGYGLFDMAGNVDEWCWDRYAIAYYSGSPNLNPRGPESGSHRVLRGGGADQWASNCRLARRGNALPATANTARGFRIVLPAVRSEDS